MSKHIHILGVCGTFMGGVAAIAKSLGFKVSGQDQTVYPPMSTQLEDLGIVLQEGYHAAHIPDDVDQVIVGNALSRGNPAVEAVLNNQLNYTSGPRWIADNALAGKWVLAVSGTHGKTTTASLLAWILEAAGLNPGFLIGGVAENFGISARVTDSQFFVIEADEYDSAFFDKRSKFVHYRPRTLTINNLEFDHADIFDDLKAIQKQFHHLVRTVPSNGLIIGNEDSPKIRETLAMGCWTDTTWFSTGGADSDWKGRMDGSKSIVVSPDEQEWTLDWTMAGEHNLQNALAALVAANHAGVDSALAVQAMSQFEGVKRRLELIASGGDVSIYDDFAHHPTAIRMTLETLARMGDGGRVVAVLEPRSNTMKMGTHGAEMVTCLSGADRVYLYQPKGMKWDTGLLDTHLPHQHRVAESVEDLLEDLVRETLPGDRIVIMSNGGFEGLHGRLVSAMGMKSD